MKRLALFLTAALLVGCVTPGPGPIPPDPKPPTPDVEDPIPPAPVEDTGLPDLRPAPYNDPLETKARTHRRLGASVGRTTQERPLLAGLCSSSGGDSAEPSVVKPSISWRPYGKTITIYQPILVDNGQILNGALPNGKITAIKMVGMGDGSQKEGQKPAFIVRWGEVKNYRILAPACDGVHLNPRPGKSAKVTGLEIPDVGEDAVTVERGKGGYARIHNGKFDKAGDKVVQVNGEHKTYVEDCQFANFQRAVRGCGTCGNRSYWIRVDGGKSWGGASVLKITNSNGYGELRNFTAYGAKQLVDAQGGAEIKVVNSKLK